MSKNKYFVDDFTRNDVKYYENKIMNTSKKISKKKVSQDNFVIPKLNQYDNIIIYNFNVLQLKMIAKKYKLKVSGNKNELNKRIYLYLLYNSKAIKIQSCVRRKFVYKYINIHGPSFRKREECVNDKDFFTLDNISDIDYINFFSEEDGGKFYGFDVASLYNYIKKEKNEGRGSKNPFTNCEFNNGRVYHRVKRFIKISKILNTGLNINSFEEENNINTQPNNFGHNVRQLFLYIDSLGNYTNYEWFMNLNRHQLIKYIRELHDIWNYRADLSEQVRKNICSPNGNPFVCRETTLPLVIITDIVPVDTVRIRTFMVMENMVRHSINRENSAIGCYYLLGALTLVSEDAANAIPWLYQCMFHN